MKHLRKIFENSIQNVDEIEVVNYCVREIPNDNFKTELMVAQFLSEEGLSDFEGLEDAEIANTDSFKKWLEYEMQYRFGDLKDKFNRMKSNDMLEIYREMKVPTNWIKSLKNPTHLGIYWSYDKSAAEAHWGHSGEVAVLITATVEFEKIDWYETFRANLDVSIGEMEKEIRLFEDTSLSNVIIEINSKQINIEEINFVA